MKINVTFKDPDNNLFEAIRDDVCEWASQQEIHNNADRHDFIMKTRAEAEEAFSKFIEFGEYVTLSYDLISKEVSLVALKKK